MSIGEDRVRTSFNPSSDSKVDELKRLTADLINRCADGRDSRNGEEARLWSLAMTRMRRQLCGLSKPRRLERSKDHDSRPRILGLDSMTLFWHQTGPMIRYEHGILCVESLNPQSAVRFRMSRFEMIKLGLRCLLATLR